MSTSTSMASTATRRSAMRTQARQTRKILETGPIMLCIDLAPREFSRVVGVETWLILLSFKGLSSRRPKPSDVSFP